MKKCKNIIQSFNKNVGKMNIKMRVVWLLLFGQFPISGYCQDDSRKEFSNVICDYYLPTNKNGLTITSFNISSKIRIERWEKNAQIILDIQNSQGTASNPDPKFKYSYNYMGKQYGDQHVGKDPFESIATENLTYEVMVTYGDKIFGWKKVDGKTNFFGPIEKDAKAFGVMVSVRVVGLMFKGTNEIENKIRGLIQGNTTETSGSSNPRNNYNSTQSKNSNGSAQTGNQQQQNQQQQNQQQKGSGNLKNNTSGNSGSSNTTSSDSNAIPTTKPLNNYDANTGLYSNPMTNSSNESSYDKDLQRAELVVDVANGILDLFATSPEEKAREEREAAETRARAERYAAEKKALAEREENLRRENEAAAAAAKAKRIQMIASRKTLFKTFPDGKTPLSYQAKGATEVYFFTYSYQPATLEEDAPLIYISNVFSVAKYGDGSWPFKSNLIANIAKTNKGLDLILSGYYESREKAEEEQQLLISTANSYEFSVKSISYNGIKSEDKSNTSTDYWGNDTNKTNSKTNSANKNNQASKNSAGEQDFWGNPTINDKKKAVSSTEKKQANKVTKEDTDFWGNTTKTTRVMLFGYVYFQKCNSEEVQYYRKLLVDEDSYQEESKIMEEKLNEDYPNAKRIMVGSSKFEYGSGVDHMCLIKWRAGSKACSYFIHSISFGKTQKEALNNALNKKNTYADKKAAYEIVEQKYW